MKKILLFYIFFVCLYLFSCSHSEKIERLSYIQGEWVFDSSRLNTIDSTVLSRIRENCGFLFKGNTSCELKCRILPKKTKYICYGMVPGYSTNFQLADDTLKIWYAEEKNWRSFFIKNLNNDSMMLISPDRNYELLYLRPVAKKVDNAFDEITVRKLFSGEGYDCDEEFFYLNRKGLFMHYEGNKNTITSYSVKTRLKDTLLSNFRYLDFESLRPIYMAGGFSWYSAQYEITFFKNDKIVKRVMDNTLVAPDELLQGYVPIVFLPKRVADGGIRELEGEVEVDVERIRRLWGG